MRDIRFRMWHPAYGKMYNWGRVVGLYSIRGMLENEDVVTMQYTGLNDRNGKEIYEGDVIRYTALQLRGFKDTKVLKVFFDGGQFKTDKSTIKAVHLICEVIGNIYENPELLGGSDNDA